MLYGYSNILFCCETKNFNKIHQLKQYGKVQKEIIIMRLFFAQNKTQIKKERHIKRLILQFEVPKW